MQEAHATKNIQRPFFLPQPRIATSPIGPGFSGLHGSNQILRTPCSVSAEYRSPELQDTALVKSAREKARLDSHPHTPRPDINSVLGNFKTLAALWWTFRSQQR